MNHDLGAWLGADFAGEFPDAYVLREPKPRMPLYHLVGALDPLDDGEVTKPVGDGLPDTLPQWIRFNGLTHLKIKLNGDDLAWDVERVSEVDRIASETQRELGVSAWYYSLDFNERCPNVEYLLELLRKLRERAPAGFDRMQYIEQPTARDLRAHPQNRMHEAAKLKPVVIDESLTDLESLLLAREMGYTGAALKACKGQSQSLLMAAAAQKLGMFLCVQDLPCPGASLIHSAGLAAHVPGVAAIESNSRQYCPAANAAGRKISPASSRSTTAPWTQVASPAWAWEPFQSDPPMKLLIFFASLLFFCSPSPAADSRPNFLFILGDNLGRDWFGCYGADNSITPNIDRLAAAGTRFQHCYVTPLCSTTRVQLLTGRYGYSTGWHTHHDAATYGGGGLDPKRETTFARALRDAGYATAIAGKWQINDLYDQRDALKQHGFDEHLVWTGALVGEGLAEARWQASIAPGGKREYESRYHDPVIFRNGVRETLTGKFGPDVYADHLVDFMARHREKPFIAYYACPLTHVPTVTDATESRPEGAATRAVRRHGALLRHTGGPVGKGTGAARPAREHDHHRHHGQRHGEEPRRYRWRSSRSWADSAP